MYLDCMGELANQFFGNQLVSIKSKEILKNPTLFNEENVSITKAKLDIDKGTYSEYSDDFGSVKSFKKLSVDKDRETGDVNSDIKTIKIVERDGVNFLSMKKLSVCRTGTKKVSNISNSLRLRLDKDKEGNLPFLVSTLLDRNLL